MPRHDGGHPDQANVVGIARHFNGQVGSIGVSVGYQAGLVIVAIAMVMLPVIYLGLIAATGLGVYWHAVEHIEILTNYRGGLWALFGRTLLYAGPLIAGAILILFMLKPLVARQTRATSFYTVEREQEPELYAFVDAVASSVGAPSPSIIRLSCEVNAGAGFRRGLWSVLTNDMVLVIGMPLAAGLNMRQFAGVLAHELGHFSQWLAMRMTFMIARINGWFARVVFERDQWDHKLAELSVVDNLWVQLVFLLARLCVWISRLILTVFLFAAGAMSCFLLRQMEFNADRYEVAVAGCDAFESTLKRMREMTIAAQSLERRVGAAQAAGQLADDFPAMVAAMPASTSRVDQTLFAEPRGFFSTHPSDDARIHRAKARRGAGIFTIERPCAVLFRNYAVLCKWVTLGHYESMLGRSINAEQLVPVERLLAHRRLDDDSRAAFERYFGNLLSSLRWLTAIEPEPILDQAAVNHAVAALGGARQRMMQLAKDGREAIERMESLESERMRFAIIDEVTRTGLTNAQRMTGMNAEHLRRRREETERALEASVQKVRAVESVIRSRLNAALRLGATPRLGQRLGVSEKLRRHLQELLPALRAVGDVHEPLTALRKSLLMLTS